MRLERHVGEACGLAYIREGGGPAVVLLHGFCSTAHSWLPVIPALAGSFDVIAPTWPGFSTAPRRRPCSTIAEMADLIVDFADHLGLASFSVMGHSMSGFVVQDLLCRHASRLEKAIIYGSGLKVNEDSRFESLDASIARLQRDGVLATARRVCATWFVTGTEAPSYAVSVEQAASMRIDAGIAALQATRACDFTGRLSQVEQDTLVVLGDRDRTFRILDGMNLAVAIPRGDLCVLPGCAHAAHLERPQLFNSVVQDFLLRDPHAHNLIAPIEYCT